MRTRHAALLLLAPLVTGALSASLLGLTGCDNAVTLEDRAPGPVDGGNGDAPSLLDANPELDSSRSDGDAAQVIEPETAQMSVDGITCTGVTHHVTTQTAPDGKTWTLSLIGTCGALGLVDVFVASKDDVAYPQTCPVTGNVQMSVGAEGDAGFLAYSTSQSGGSCAIGAGPSTAAQGTPPELTATVSNGSGQTHLLNFTRVARAPKGAMVVDGVTCTGIVSSVKTQFAPDGKTWTLDASGNCGALGIVRAYVVGKDDLAYPQSCALSPFIQMSVGSEGDAGMLAYESDKPGGSCLIATGPSATALATGITVTATVTNDSGKARSFAYTAANAP